MAGRRNTILGRVLRLPAAVLAIAACLVLPASALGAVGPSLVGSIDSNDPTVTNGALTGTTATAVAGNYAYTTSYSSGQLAAINISNPAAPSFAGASGISNGTNVNNLTNATTVNVSTSLGLAAVVAKNRNGTCMPGPPPGNCGSGSNDDGTGNALTLLDISTNPANPTVVGTLRDTTHFFGAYGVAFDSTRPYVYVAAQGCLNGGQPCPNPNVGNTFEVVNISTPATPTIAATIHNTSLLDHADGVYVSGHYAYVSASYSSTETIIDITNPTNPSIVGHITDTNNLNFPVDTVTKGNYAFVINQTQLKPNFSVLDVSNPASPTLVTTLTDSTNLNGAYRMRLRGNLIYVSANGGATIAAIDISDPVHPRLAGAITDSVHLNHTTGLDLDATGTHVIANSPNLSSQSGTNYPPFTPGTGTVSAITLDPQPISVSIGPSSEPPNPTTQRGASFAFAVNDAIATVSCSLDGVAAGLCTSPTTQNYGSLAPGSHTFTVTATDSAGTTSTASYTWAVDAAPANTAAPTVTGKAVEKQVLTGHAGSWTGTPAPTFAYAWSDCDAAGTHCTAITGATSGTYTLRHSDVGKRLRLTVTASNRAGNIGVNSAPTASVTALAVKATLGRASVKKTTLSLPSTCPAGAGVSCHLTLRLTVTTRVKGKQHTTVVGTKQVTIAPGHKTTVRVSLNRAGKRLLTSLRTLHVKLTIKQSLGTVTRKLTFKQK